MTGAASNEIIDPKVQEYRLRMLEQSQRDIAESLKALVRLEQHHADTRLTLERALAEQAATRERVHLIAEQIPDKLEERLSTIEKDLPTLRLTSSWVVTFTLGGFALAALLIWSVATDRHAHTVAAQERRVTVEQDKPAD